MRKLFKYDLMNGDLYLAGIPHVDFQSLDALSSCLFIAGSYDDLPWLFGRRVLEKQATCLKVLQFKSLESKK